MFRLPIFLIALLHKPQRSHRYACVCEAALSEKYSAPNIKVFSVDYTSVILMAHCMDSPISHLQFFYHFSEISNVLGLLLFQISLYKQIHNRVLHLDFFCKNNLRTTIAAPKYAAPVDLCQYFGQKKSKDYAAFFSSSSSFCCGVK